MKIRYWRKASRSSGTNSNCVEVAGTAQTVAVRDSKDCAGSGYPTLAVDRPAWLGFVDQLKAGDLDGK